MIAPGNRMKMARTFLLVLSFVGFTFSLGIHLLALSGRVRSSESWYVVPFIGSFVAFVLAVNLSGAKPGRMGMIPQSKITKGCPPWLKKTDWFLFAYTFLAVLWIALRNPGVFHWRKVELSPTDGFFIFSAFSMMFYVSSFSMIFGRLFGESNQSTPSSDATQETT